MKWFVLIFFSTILLGCNTKDKEPNKKMNERSMNDPSKSMLELKDAVLTKGDTNAYYELSVAYLDYTVQEEFLIYAITMANKYDYPQAYFDVYSNLIGLYQNKHSEIDNQTANLAIDYLLKAFNKGHHQAKEIVEEYTITYNITKNREQVLRILKSN